MLTQATGLAAEMLAHGTTTLECKSGYGLSREAEMRALGLARELETEVAPDDDLDGAARPRRPRRLHRGLVDGRRRRR